MSNELIVVESFVPEKVFVPGGVKPIVERIRDIVTKEIYDVTTRDGRERIASVAYSIARSKTFLDNKGKEMVEGWKTQAKVVDNERKYARDELERLKEEISKPLTDYELAEEKRIERLKGMIEKVIKAGQDISAQWATIAAPDMEVQRDTFAKQLDAEQWEEFQEWASGAYMETILQINVSIEKKRKYDAEQEELIRLRAEAAKREQEDRERRIAEEAAAKAKKDAEEAAQRAAKEAEREARAEAERLEREALAAKERALEAERKECEAKEREEHAKKDAESAAIRAKEDAERMAQEAVERERERVRAEEARQEAIRKAREDSKRHCDAIHAKAAQAIVANVLNEHTENRGIDLAMAIVEKIAAGEIPNIRINY